MNGNYVNESSSGTNVFELHRYLLYRQYDSIISERIYLNVPDISNVLRPKSMSITTSLMPLKMYEKETKRRILKGICSYVTNNLTSVRN